MKKPYFRAFRRLVVRAGPRRDQTQADQARQGPRQRAARLPALRRAEGEGARGGRRGGQPHRLRGVQAVPGLVAEGPGPRHGGAGPLLPPVVHRPRPRPQALRQAQGLRAQAAPRHRLAGRQGLERHDPQPGDLQRQAGAQLVRRAGGSEPEPGQGNEEAPGASAGDGAHRRGTHPDRRIGQGPGVPPLPLRPRPDRGRGPRRSAPSPPPSSATATGSWTARRPAGPARSGACT